MNLEDISEYKDVMSFADFGDINNLLDYEFVKIKSHDDSIENREGCNFPRAVKSHPSISFIYRAA